MESVTDINAKMQLAGWGGVKILISGMHIYWGGGDIEIGNNVFKKAIQNESECAADRYFINIYSIE